MYEPGPPDIAVTNVINNINDNNFIKTANMQTLLIPAVQGLEGGLRVLVNVKLKLYVN